ncbi:Transcriptional regulator GlxA family, contains an amidase domain and an AraC-type DNA-binding HTH domain [Ralstonia sp. 25mfcol4.1]|uniref:GlxA family transcriptional regulator n=1 Tax=Ralstonia sp. 25mfcol4.1 TaxID=1761899 RepID=UPI000891C219|nr:DJ-1/PfpI family protein [Ralstonia sp. 25mfcol4.1]SDP61426.1 Transcriptional regulator GlxA family, contains an amidase domain and an AraC-type DNA-binding HTH domain [Ralstonia sp. 25mfcol4.1]
MAGKDNIAALSATIGAGAVPARHVVLVAFDGVEAIDVAGPASALSKAAEYVPGAYRLTIASPSGGDVRTNAGLTIAATQTLSTVAVPIDTLIVAGGDEPALRAAIVEQGVSEWVARMAPEVRRVASVCTGAFALAAAGILDGRQCTTHRNACAMLQSMFPKAHVLNDPIYVCDDGLWTSAGVTTGLDMTLGMIAADLGQPVAIEIARNLAVYMLRGSTESQESRTLAAQARATPRVRELVAWIMNNLSGDLSVESMAQRVLMSPRSLARSFLAETGSTPAAFVMRSRLERATTLLLQTDWPQEKIASESGFRSVDALQRAFGREKGCTPNLFRANGGKSV